ncbi:MAG: choice-of-anchor tandem repeat GloVer-containing protein [Candidatus Korobacteraceae bacterium]|jgi:uncharacterized repeat protein (TIGR03803 family)
MEDSPSARLYSTAAGNLYGTTQYGGSANAGVVFKLTPSGSGWSESVLHSFTGEPTDGSQPTSGLVLDAAGNLYGATIGGGSNNNGRVFQLMPSGSGWTENILHSFNFETDGLNPYGGLIFDHSGNLYGSTAFAALGDGTVFELAPSGGEWIFTTLYNLTSGQAGLPGSLGTLALDAAGNLYGTTYEGGLSEGCIGYGCGTVFELAPSSGGWAYSLLHEFLGGQDGSNPAGGLILDPQGNLYGTASTGAYGYGAVWELTP